MGRSRSDPGQALAAELRRMKVRSDVSLKRLERYAHVSDSSLSRYLSGQSIAPWVVVETFARLDGRDPERLRAMWNDARLARRRGRTAAASTSTSASKKPGTSATPPAPRPSNRPRNELPRDVVDFTGREAEVELLLGEGRAGGSGAVRIVAIDGMAGVGKTALAVHAAHLLDAEYPDGRLYIDLHGHTPTCAPVPSEAALRMLLGSLGAAADRMPDSVAELASLWRTELAGRRILTVLDNAADAEQVRHLLPGTAGCLVLITSRRRLADLDGARQVSLGVLPEADAAAMFESAVGDSRVATADDEDLGSPHADAADRAGASGEILRLCGYLPLAIRLAAARLRHRPAWRVADLVELLRDEQSRLAELRTGDRGVAAAFAVSEQHLEPSQRRLFRLLGLVPGEDFDASAAAAVARLPVAEARRLLEDLVDVHLLEQPSAGRYRFHDLVRRHARDAVEAAETVDVLRDAERRLLDHYLAATRVADADATGTAWLRAERINLHLTVRYAAAHGYPGHALELVRAMFGFLRAQGHRFQAVGLYEIALDAAHQIGDVSVEAEVLTGLGRARLSAEQYEAARDSFRKAIELFREVGDRESEATVTSELARIDHVAGDCERSAA